MTSGKHILAPELSAAWKDYYQPGVHSYNFERRQRRSGSERSARSSGLGVASKVFLLLGLAGIAAYAYSIAEESIYQSYANWAFDQKIAGSAATFLDYLRWRAGFSPAGPAVKPANLPRPSEAARRPAPGEMLGRVSISRLNLSATVLEGVDDATLRRSAGHVPSTALPGEPGNFSIAAHRDTLFRPLKDIRVGDEVQFATSRENLVFRVVSTRIVEPTDSSVMRPQGDARLLTMITCYPFYYVGSAPKRFIVTARLERGASKDEPAAPDLKPSVTSSRVGGA